ncbi:MAG: hypothetical protein Q8R28_17045 [Dehalococcoidia bacterium]|nr:hypothetical protein [Dehalococcoidia bacterium]
MNYDSSNQRAFMPMRVKSDISVKVPATCNRVFSDRRRTWGWVSHAPGPEDVTLSEADPAVAGAVSASSSER